MGGVLVRDRLYRIVRIVLCVVAVFLFFIGIAHLPLISVRSVEVHPDSTVTGVLQDDVGFVRAYGT